MGDSAREGAKYIAEQIREALLVVTGRGPHMGKYAVELSEVEIAAGFIATPFEANAFSVRVGLRGDGEYVVTNRNQVLRVICPFRGNLILIRGATMREVPRREALARLCVNPEPLLLRAG